MNIVNPSQIAHKMLLIFASVQNKVLIKDSFEKNYNKVFMTMGDKENKLYYDSLEELKIDVEWLCKHVHN